MKSCRPGFCMRSRTYMKESDRIRQQKQQALPLEKRIRIGFRKG